MSEYGYIGDDEWIRPRHDDFKLACCDCGLVHTMLFRVDPDDGQIEFQIDRDNRATGQMRRHMKKE